MPTQLSPDERSTLLKIARQSLIDAAHDRPAAPLPADLPPALLEKGASFVTLTMHGQLRGCIGTLEAYQPLAQDVRQRAAQAATQDYRFPRVRPGDVEHIHIEISRLTIPTPLPYSEPEELPRLLRPHVDGVVLSDGRNGATFLPQVWEQLPDPAEFLSHLCQKMGARSDLWRRKVLSVEIYQVEEFEEARY
ncbi:MAG: AmmeMemoRadiSam system protein A [Chloroflexi bacterium]|jgi:AmmeMemoRadiSam system protein A|nr:AmmeMemoRadiSam system protein A [Chloroflexota bacterium]